VSRLKSNFKQFIKQIAGARLQQRLRKFYLTRQIMKGQGFRELELAALRFLISAGDYVADIGANAGAYTKELSSLVGSQGCVYSFEPVSKNYEILYHLVRKAGLNNVKTYPYAIGSRTMEATIVVPDMEGFTGYYWAYLSESDKGGASERVQMHTLDELLTDRLLHRLDFIKCDVEGSELHVLYGSRDLMSRFIPGWLIEVSRDTSNDVFNLFRASGYVSYVYNGMLIETERYRDKEYSNYFFIHPKSIIRKRAIPLIR